MATTAPPFVSITEDDRGSYVTIPNCMLIVFSGIVVLSRGLARLRITGLSKSDDAAISISLVSSPPGTLSPILMWCVQAFAIVETVCLQLAVTHGLGIRETTFVKRDFDTYSKVRHSHSRKQFAD
jgi:hypothetical protein